MSAEQDYFDFQLEKEIDLEKYRSAIRDTFIDEFLKVHVAMVKARYQKNVADSPHSDWGPIEMSLELSLGANLSHAVEAIQGMGKIYIDGLSKKDKKAWWKP